MSYSSATVRVQLTGLHSRSETLVELTREYDRNRASWSQVEEETDQESIQLIRFQEKLGCQPINDGALGWKDQLRPIAHCISGLAETTRYSRWYDTNTFYLKPIVSGPLRITSFQPGNFLRAGLLPKAGDWSVVIPGPWTLSELSENKYYATERDLLEDYSRVLREIIARLAQTGVKHVQLSEPSLVYWPYREKRPTSRELDDAISAIRWVIENGPVDFTVHTFFGDATPILPLLLKLPVYAVGVDLYETDWQKLPRIPDATGLVLGIVDSEESLVETPGWIVKTAKAVHKRVESDSLTLAPNTDLKFVPREIADRKLESLGLAANVLNKHEEAFA